MSMTKHDTGGSPPGAACDSTGGTMKFNCIDQLNNPLTYAKLCASNCHGHGRGHGHGVFILAMHPKGK